MLHVHENLVVSVRYVCHRTNLLLDIFIEQTVKLTGSTLSWNMFQKSGIVTESPVGNHH